VEKQEVARLYDIYSRDVYRLALGYLRSTQDAEDICQSVFLKLLETNPILLSQKEKASIKMHRQCLQKPSEILLETAYRAAA